MAITGVSGQDLAALYVSAERRSPAPQLRSSEAVSTGAAKPVAVESTEEQVSSAASPRQAAATPRTTHTSMSVDAQSKRIVVRILDENNEVIKQIPAEELLHIAEQSREVEGLLFDKHT